MALQGPFSSNWGYRCLYHPFILKRSCQDNWRRLRLLNVTILSFLALSMGPSYVESCSKKQKAHL